MKCPTLLIVGGDDKAVIGMNQRAMRNMTASVSIEIIPGATHLFEEAGALEQVARLARVFFMQHLQAAAPNLILDGLDPPAAGRQLH